MFQIHPLKLLAVFYRAVTQRNAPLRGGIVMASAAIQGAAARRQAVRHCRCGRHFGTTVASPLPLPRGPGIPWAHRGTCTKRKKSLRAPGTRVRRRAKVANGCASSLAGLGGKVRDGGAEGPSGNDSDDKE